MTMFAQVGYYYVGVAVHVRNFSPYTLADPQVHEVNGWQVGYGKYGRYCRYGRYVMAGMLWQVYQVCHIHAGRPQVQEVDAQ